MGGRSDPASALKGGGDFKRLRRERVWTFQEEAPDLQPYFENPGAGSGGGVIPFGLHSSESSPPHWPWGWVSGGRRACSGSGESPSGAEDRCVSRGGSTLWPHSGARLESRVGGQWNVAG